MSDTPETGDAIVSALRTGYTDLPIVILETSRKLERQRDFLKEELENIATADPSEWGDLQDQFQAWAQNQAKTALLTYHKR